MPKSPKKKKQKHTRTKREFEPDIVETKDFAAEVIVDNESRPNLKWSSPAWFRHQIGKFKVGEKVTVYVSNKRPKRTLAQNAYYWGVYLPMIAKETGEHDLERLHTYFKGMFLTTEIVEVFGKPVRLTRSTSSLNKSDFSEYIMNIEAETGIEAPPTENYGL